MAQTCQAANCTNDSTARCSRCTKERLSNNFGWYCCRDCQTAHWAEHLNFHKMMMKPSTMSHYNETISVSLKELSLIDRLSNLSSVNSFFIYILGATILEQSEYEDESTFKDLFQKLQAFVFPTIQSLHLTIIGSDVSRTDATESPEEIISITTNTTTKSFACGDVTYIHNGSTESHLQEIDASSSVVYIFHPAFSVKVDSWYSTVQQLITRNLITVTTGHGSLDYINHDKIHDEGIIADYYGAQMLLSMTHNPAFVDNYGDGKYAQHAFYLAFQGSKDRRTPSTIGEEGSATESVSQRVTATPLLSRNEIVYRIKLNTLRQAVINERVLCQDETTAKNVERLIYDIENRIIELPGGSTLSEDALEELLSMAERYKL